MQSAALATVKIRSNITALLYVSGLVLLGGTAAWAQAPASSPPAQHAMTDAEKNKQLADQIAELRAQVAKLQAAQQSAPAKKDTPAAGMKMPPAKPMGMMDDKGEMGMAPKGAKPTGKAAMPAGRGMGMGMPMKDDDEGEMSGMPAGGTASMSSAPAPAMGMCCMGEMGAMPGAASGGMSGGAAPAPGGMAGMNMPSSAMPGQPGASHLYHVGSTGFFLNHPQHITLTADQKTALNRVKEKAMLDRASDQRQIDQAEQELYTLTGADSFDNAKVQAKIGEIEKLRAGQRMNFIKAVGEASNVLTHDQHQALMGTMPVGKK
jgi:Spy/CpxP family protein refolding chaperone